MPIMKAFDLVNWIIAAVALLHKISKVGSGRATVKARERTRCNRKLRKIEYIN